MKVGDLKQIIDSRLKHALSHEDDTVRIAVKLPYQTVGAIPMVDVKSAHFGFDWERGSFILYPEEELTPSDSRVGVNFPWTKPDSPEYVFVPTDEFPNEVLKDENRKL